MTAGIIGLGIAVPDQIVTNADLERRLDTSDEWIRTRTGISARHVAEPGTSTGDLAVSAGRRAMAAAGTERVDAVVLATTTPDQPVPATSPQVATRLGLDGAIAFDVNAACVGFVAALATGCGLVAAGIAPSVLVIGADTMSRFVDPDDRATAVLFGDGAGAVVLEALTEGAPGELGSFDLGSDGSHTELLHIPAGGSARPTTAETVAGGEHRLRMSGPEVYREAVVGMTASARRTMSQAGLDSDGIDYLVAHQANARILSAVADRLEIPVERQVLNIDRYGNTSAASIPLALADLSDAGAQPGDRVLLTAFGAGLSWASALLRWPDLKPPTN